MQINYVLEIFSVVTGKKKKKTKEENERQVVGTPQIR